MSAAVKITEETFKKYNAQRQSEGYIRSDDTRVELSFKYVHGNVEVFPIKNSDSWGAVVNGRFMHDVRLNFEHELEPFFRQHGSQLEPAEGSADSSR